MPKLLWDEAQHKIDTGKTFSKRATVNEYLVGWRIRCECGYKMRATPMYHTYTRLDGSTKCYEYSKYVCPGSTKSKTGDVARSCDLPKIRVGEVDEQVWQWVKEDIASPDVLERKLRELQAEQRNEQGDTRTTIATLEAHKAEIEGELARLGTLYAKQGMPSRIVDDLIAEQGKKLELTEIEIRKLTLQLETPLTDEDIGSLLLFSIDFGQHLEAVEGTFEGRRTVIDGLDVSVEIFRKEGAVWMKMTSILRPEGVSARLFLTP